MIDQTQGLIMTNLQQIPIETYNLLIDKIQQISTALENLTIDFDYNQINENIYDTLTPCFEELKSLIQSNDNSQGGSLDIDSEYLKKLIGRQLYQSLHMIINILQSNLKCAYCCYNVAIVIINNYSI